MATSLSAASIPSIAVIVVTWNTRDLLRACLTALTAPADDGWMRIVCIDNGSTDGTADMVAREFPTVLLVRRDQNIGFPGGANVGITLALERFAPRFVALVNSDLVVTPDTLAALVRHLERHEEVAAVSPRLRHPSGTLQSGAAGFAPTAWTGIAHFLFLSALTRGRCRGVFINQHHFIRRSEAVAVDWVTGACPVMRTEAIQRVGLLEEAFFMYADDVDWCCRARRAGFAIHFLPTVEAVHWQGATSPTADPKWLASLCALVRRDRGTTEYIIFRLAAAVGFALRCGLYALAFVARRDRKYWKSAGDMLVYAQWAFDLRRGPTARGDAPG